MQKPTAAAYERATSMRKAGKTNKEIMEGAPEGERLSHSQLERHFMAEDIGQYGGWLIQPESLTAKAALVAKLREAGQSWGVISVRLREPESRTRADFTEATGLRSKGMRIGKGGRWVANDRSFYVGADRAKLGKELTTARPIHDQVPNPDAPEQRQLPKLAEGASPKPQRQSRKPKAMK